MRVWRQPIRRQPLRCLTLLPLLSRQRTTRCPGASPSRRPSPRPPRAPPTCSTTQPSSRPTDCTPRCPRLARLPLILSQRPRSPRWSQRRGPSTIKPMARSPRTLIASLLMAAVLLVSSNQICLWLWFPNSSVGEADKLNRTFVHVQTWTVCDWFPVAGDDRLASPLAMSWWSARGRWCSPVELHHNSTLAT